MNNNFRPIVKHIIELGPRSQLDDDGFSLFYLPIFHQSTNRSLWLERHLTPHVGFGTLNTGILFIFAVVDFLCRGRIKLAPSLKQRSNSILYYRPNLDLEYLILATRLYTTLGLIAGLYGQKIRARSYKRKTLSNQWQWSKPTQRNFIQPTLVFNLTNWLLKSFNPNRHFKVEIFFIGANPEANLINNLWS